MPIRRLIFAVLLLIPALVRAQDFETRAPSAWVYDETTGTVLLSKNADVPLPPASMSKLMTIYMAFEAVAQGRLSIDDELVVSQHAMDYGGSSMFLVAGERVRVEDLLRGVIVLSGNDASTVLAEALSPDGTEAGFARLMTERAQAMGLTQSHFMNANGWPAPGHVMSMRDLGMLAHHIISDFPTFYPLFAEREFAFDGRVPANSLNRNPILGMGLGADGLKTGHTQEAGYGLVGSAVQGDRRVIFVISGLATEAERREEAERILTWAFRQFALRELGQAGDPVGRAEVWMGAQGSVDLALAEDLAVLVPAAAGDSLSAEVVYRGPLQAPVAAGDVVAELVVRRGDLPELTVPLVAATDVPVGGFTVRLQAAFRVLMGRLGFGPAAPAGGA